MNNSLLYPDDRPPLPLGDLTWNDHGCIDHYQPGVLGADNLTLPTFVEAKTR